MNDLKVGDRVRWVDYGDGEVLSVAPGRLVIDWEREGVLDHLPGFGRRLTRL
jgi:hypothetical protein